MLHLFSVVLFFFACIYNVFFCSFAVLQSFVNFAIFCVMYHFACVSHAFSLPFLQFLRNLLFCDFELFGAYIKGLRT